MHGARRWFCRDDVGVYGGFGVVDYRVATGEVRLWYGFDTGNPRFCYGGTLRAHGQYPGEWIHAALCGSEGVCAQNTHFQYFEK